MKIATFGSCLSRYIGNNYTYLYGGKIVSSVYHNRSDMVIGRFIDNTIPHLARDQIAELLVKPPEEASIDDKGDVIISNQYPESIGLHRLRGGTQFFEMLEKQEADLVILDNYMDIGARLMTIEGAEPGSQWFVRPKDFIDKTICTPGPLLSPADGVEAMLKIIKYIQEKMPKAKIIFCNFPHNTYHASPERVQRTQEYEALMASKADGSFTIIECMDIPERFQTKEKQHFRKEMYCSYAGAIWSLMTKLA